MAAFEILLRQVGVFVILILVGYGASVSKLVSEAGFASIASVVINLLLPLFMLTMLSSPSLRLQIGELALMFAAIALHYLLLFGGIRVIARLMGWTGLFRDLNLVLLTSASAGFMGVPLASVLLGATGTFYIALFASLDVFLQWSYKARILRAYQPEAMAASPQPFLKRVLTPQIVCVVVGITLGLMRVDLSGNIVWDTLKSVGDMTKWMGMLYVGSVLADMRLEHLRPALFVLLLRMLLYPILFCGLFSLIPGISSDLLLTLAIITSLPPMVSIPVMIHSMGIDDQYTSQCLLLTTAASLFSMPAVIWVVMHAFA
ncbi:MAG TPA: AEC family transporter [Feifaniaceae bacterium]|nr:AEC family transporter [Feifaniaceae bacterium]